MTIDLRKDAPRQLTGVKPDQLSKEINTLQEIKQEIENQENKIKEMEGLLAELRDGVGENESLAVSGDHDFMIAPIINTLESFLISSFAFRSISRDFNLIRGSSPTSLNSFSSSSWYSDNV